MPLTFEDRLLTAVLNIQTALHAVDDDVRALHTIERDDCHRVWASLAAASSFLEEAVANLTPVVEAQEAGMSTEDCLERLARLVERTKGES